MKIFNYGNDYALQQKQKLQEEKNEVCPIHKETTPEKTIEITPNVEAEIQGGGGGDMEISTPKAEACQESSKEAKEEVPKKKKTQNTTQKPEV